MTIERLACTGEHKLVRAIQSIKIRPEYRYKIYVYKITFGMYTGPTNIIIKSYNISNVPCPKPSPFLRIKINFREKKIKGLSINQHFQRMD